MIDEAERRAGECVSCRLKARGVRVSEAGTLTPVTTAAAVSGVAHMNWDGY